MRDRISVGRKTTTIRRNLGIVSAVINFAIREKELSSTNPFEALQISGEGEDAEVRIPFSHNELLTVSKAALEKNEQFAWIASILIETGARIGEIACAKVEDVFLDGLIPYIHLREHLDEGRRLKTGRGSERVLPLKGCALWGVKQALSHAGTDPWLFPKYGPIRRPRMPLKKSIAGSKASELPTNRVIAFATQ